ncbi:phosphotransferase family protein [Brachybacterium squillarum]|uniref:phosphotransferase family protein n=1 Tax=Brachybacterium squillarum TaxID=661979 RepID=UPI0002629571|nr:aminoglycoside phosphotransferase family protein [Brachybacterium squillarum]
MGEVRVLGELRGGITARMLRLRRPGGEDLVLRRWSGEDPGEREAVSREVAGLDALAATDLPVPRLLAADVTGAEAGVPVTVTTLLPGAVTLMPADRGGWVRELAGMLARIHAVPVPAALEPCEEWESEDQSWLETDPGLAREARALAARPAEPSRAVLAHGDYQHFNVLWQGGRVSGVVDWPTVGRADRGRDTGHCRLNLAVLFEADVAMDFLDAYEERAGAAVDPAADLRRLLSFGPGWPVFLPRQVDGRASVDGPGMAARVRETIRCSLRRAG